MSWRDRSPMAKRHLFALEPLPGAIRHFWACECWAGRPAHARTRAVAAESLSESPLVGVAKAGARDATNRSEQSDHRKTTAAFPLRD
jgi:hypothetical protein